MDHSNGSPPASTKQSSEYYQLPATNFHALLQSWAATIELGYAFASTAVSDDMTCADSPSTPALPFWEVDAADPAASRFLASATASAHDSTILSSSESG